MNETICAVCGAAFMPQRAGQRCCGESCVAVARWAARKETARERHRRPPAVSIPQVMAFAERYARATGRTVAYGDAVVMLERGVRV